jgi:hypothetical protein
MRRRRYTSVFRYREGGRTIVVLIGLLGAVLVVLFVLARVDTMRRSGTAAIYIVSSSFQAGGGIEQTLQGTWLRYTYTVDGTTYPGYDFRTWSKVSAHDPKVCFEPADPRNHRLVEGRVMCGVDAGS